MRPIVRRALFALSFFPLLTTTSTARARASEEEPPTVELRTQPLKTLLDRTDYIADVLSAGDQLKPLKGLLSLFSGKQSGVDFDRPIGAYAFATANLVDGKAVLLIPITSEKDFSNLLVNVLKFDVKKGENDVYTVKSPKLPMPILYRVVGDYVFATVKDEKNIDANSVIDAKTFFQTKDTAILSLKVRFDRIPADVKKTIFGQVELGLNYLKEKKTDNDTAGKKKLREWGIERILSGGKAVIDDGKDLTLRLTVDPKTDESAFEVSFTAKNDSETAKSIREVGSIKGSAASLSSGVKNPIAALGMKMSISDNAKKELAAVVDELIHDTVEEAKDDDQEGSRMVWSALAPTLKSGDWEAGALLVGPDEKGKFTFVAATKTVEGKEIESLIKTVASYLPDEQVEFDFDVKKIGGILRHDIKVKNEDINKLFGSKTIAIGTHDTQFVIGLGPNLNAFTDAAERKAMTVRPLTAEVSIARFLSLTAVKDKALLERRSGQIRKVFDKDNPTGNDTIRLTLDAGDALTARVVAKGKALKLLVLTGK